MITDHLKLLIRNNLGHVPTLGQEALIDQLAGFILDQRAHQIYIVKGFAGTGKTSLISALVKTLEQVNMKSLLLAPTGRAAKVFSGYAGKNAFTIHRKIYRQKSANDGFGEFVLNKNLFSNLIVIIDEASMISDTLTEGSVFGSGRLLADLVGFVRDGQNCRMIVVGDTAQLPPVGIAVSPALDRNELSLYMQVAGEFLLTDIVRQNKNSGILQNATAVRNLITEGVMTVPELKHHPSGDVAFITGQELTEIMERAYQKNGIGEVMVLCRSNKRANQYNGGIRKQILYREDELSAGDQLMVVKNNYFWLVNNPDLEFIANGDILRVVKIKKFTERYGFHFAYALLELIDFEARFEAWIMLDTLTTDTASLSQEDNRKLYYSALEDYAHLDTKSKQYKAVKGDEFFNALQVKYAYAVTCHKAQGGQWKTVFIDQGYMTADKIDMEYLRWLYTAITRATELVFFVNFPKDFVQS
jgi:exodeoxyribonuclease V